LQPFAEVTGEVVALAEANHTFVAYLPHGGTITMNLPTTGELLTARWFNPRSGEFGQPAPLPLNGRQDFHAPDTNDWALVVKP
jgi:hypothetical protein